MEIKDILLLVDPAAPNAARLALGAWLAKAHGAAVRGLCLYEAPAASLAECYALGSRAVADVMRHEADAVARVLTPAHQAFLQAVSHVAVQSIWEPQPRLWMEEALRRTATADLAILGQPLVDPERWWTILERLVLAGGVPVLVAPEGGRPPPPRFHRAIVAWNGSREAKRALDDAIVLLKACAHTDLVVVDGRGAPLEADLPGLVGFLERHGVTAEVTRLQAHDQGVADVLRRHCEQTKADLLVLGAYSHSTLGERVFGGVTRNLLRAPPVATLVSH